MQHTRRHTTHDYKTNIHCLGGKIYWNFHGQFVKVEQSAAVSKVRKNWIGCRPSVLPQGQVMRISDRIIRSGKIALQGHLTMYFFLKNQQRKRLENTKFPSTNNAVIPSTVEVLYASVSQPPGRDPAPGPGINYTGPRET